MIFEMIFCLSTRDFSPINNCQLKVFTYSVVGKEGDNYETH